MILSRASTQLNSKAQIQSGKVETSVPAIDKGCYSDEALYNRAKAKRICALSGRETNDGSSDQTEQGFGQNENSDVRMNELKLVISAPEAESSVAGLRESHFVC